MKQKRKKRGRVLAVLLAVMVLITSFSFNMVSAEENAEADKVQSETIADPSSNVAEQQDVTDGDKEPEKDVEKDLETERQMKQLLKEIGVGFAESDAQANTSSMQRRAKAARAAGDVINTGRIKSNSIGRIDVINYNDPSWPQILTWREGLLGNTDTKEPLFCADPMDSFKAGKKTGVDASTIYNKETIQTVAAMMYYYDHYMCKSINSDYEYLMKQCAVWWVLNAVHGWFADGVQIETGNGVKCACGTWLSTHKGDYYANGLVWAWENYKYFLDAKGVIYQGNGQPLSSWSGTYNPSGYAKLKKSSSDTSITNGNDCYSLKDATYGVYSEKSLSGASKVGTLTTDANGDSNTLTLTAGTYYVKEVTAPKGYALDKTTYTITVKSGETSVLKVSDKPTMLVYLAPTTKEEYLAMLDWSIEQNEYPAAIRLPGGSVISDGKEITKDFGDLNKYEVTQKGSKVAVIGLGTFYGLGKEVAEELKKVTGTDATVINPYYITGIDAELLEELKKDHDVVITLEDGILDGGFGEKIARFYGDSDMKVLNFGLKKEFLDRYDVAEVLKENHLTKEQIVEDIMKFI